MGISARVHRELLESTETFASVLLLIALNQYGEGAIFGTEHSDPADPQAVFASLEADFRVKIPEANDNKYLSLFTVLTTDAFYTDPLAFSATCLTLTDGAGAGDIVDAAFSMPTMAEAMWAAQEIEFWRADDDVSFAPQVLSVWRQIVKAEAQEGDGYDEEYIALIEQLGEFSAQLKKSGFLPESA